MRKHTGMVLRTLGVGLGTLLLGSFGAVSASAGATASSYGPRYGAFHIAFPTAPKSQSNTAGVLAGFPAKTVTTATAYWVSPVADPLSSSASTPPPPTYLVVVGKVKSAASASKFTATAHQISGATAVTVNGAKGYKFSGTEKQLNPSSTTLKDPNTIEAFMYVSKGTTVYAVIVVANNHSQVQGFLTSFRPA